ncbi:metallophosphoesterase, partial [Nostoc sp. CHAB 5834]|nr:metallophosphoesterase [Nostoc sp. CHAB 5834]
MYSSPLAALVGLRALPRIHLLSDLHLESGPYTVPPTLDCDVVVAAGDIGPIDVAVPWLASLGKPVVYILGNHEFWGQELEGAVALAKNLAQGTDVHVLDNESKVVAGVRFLGTTLWTDYSDSVSLARTAYARMRDFRFVKIGSWLQGRGRAAKVARTAKELGFVRKVSDWKTPEHLHPAVVSVMHKEAVRWLKRELLKQTQLPTVVVAHHAPSRRCLKAAGVPERLFQQENWRHTNGCDDMLRVAGYASDLDKFLYEFRDLIDLFCHGHVHHAQDLLIEGVRVVSNPRGRVYDGESEIPVPTVESPLVFEPSRTIQLDDGGKEPVTRIVAKLCGLLEPIAEEVKRCYAHMPHDEPVIEAALESRIISLVKDYRGHLAVHYEKELASFLFQRHVPQPRLEPLSAPAFPEDFAHRKGFHRSVPNLLNTLRLWPLFLQQLPGLPQRELRCWARAALKAFTVLEAEGLHGVVQL